MLADCVVCCRDLACRNCLVSSRGQDRVVKIGGELLVLEALSVGSHRFLCL